MATIMKTREKQRELETALRELYKDIKVPRELNGDASKIACMQMQATTFIDEKIYTNGKVNTCTTIQELPVIDNTVKLDNRSGAFDTLNQVYLELNIENPPDCIYSVIESIEVSFMNKSIEKYSGQVLKLVSLYNGKGVTYQNSTQIIPLYTLCGVDTCGHIVDIKFEFNNAFTIKSKRVHVDYSVRSDNNSCNLQIASAEHGFQPYLVRRQPKTTHFWQKKETMFKFQATKTKNIFQIDLSRAAMDSSVRDIVVLIKKTGTVKEPLKSLKLNLNGMESTINTLFSRHITPVEKYGLDTKDLEDYMYFINFDPTPSKDTFEGTMALRRIEYSRLILELVPDNDYNITIFSRGYNRLSNFCLLNSDY